MKNIKKKELPLPTKIKEKMYNVKQYVPPYDTEEYKNAKIYVALLRGELFQIAHDTSDAETKQRIEELLDGMKEPTIIRRYEGRVRVKEVPHQKERYILVQWPDSQYLMELERFHECLLVQDIEGHDEVGSSAYICPEDLYNEFLNNKLCIK